MRWVSCDSSDHTPGSAIDRSKASLDDSILNFSFIERLLRDWPCACRENSSTIFPMQEIDVTTLTVVQLKELLESIHKQLSAFGIKANGAVRGSMPAHDYASWDWTKKNHDLASEHGVGYYTVVKWRHRLGQPSVCGGKHWPACQAWDWSKPNTQISRENKVDVDLVARWRNRLGKEPAPHDVNPSPEYPDVPSTLKRYDWTQVDWNFPDIQIARKIGCTREMVRQKRAKLGLPKCLFHNWRYEQFVKAFYGVTELTHAQAKAKFPVAMNSFRKYCAKAGIKALFEKTPTKHPWNLMNWDLSNLLLAQIWKISKSGTVANYRCNTIKPKPKIAPRCDNIPPEWQSIVGQEKLKAAEYFKETK